MPTARARVLASIGVIALLVPIVFSAVVAIVGLASGDDTPDPVELDSDSPTFTSLDELVDASDLVVVATVADISDGRTVTAPDDPDAGFRTRLVELDVSRALIGEPPTPLVVEEPAELLDGTPVIVDGMTPLDEGDEAAWFLVAGVDESQPYHAVVNAQGRVIAGAAATDDPLSQELAALGLDGVIDAVLATR
jgi:hypothetical protein